LRGGLMRPSAPACPSDPRKPPESGVQGRADGRLAVPFTTAAGLRCSKSNSAGPPLLSMARSICSVMWSAGSKRPFAALLAYYSLDVTVAAGRQVSRAGGRPAAAGPALPGRHARRV